jgi:hypothetical protein
MRLVGVGFGRTGTMSLKGALEELGVDVPDKPFARLHHTNEFRTEFGLEPLPA